MEHWRVTAEKTPVNPADPRPDLSFSWLSFANRHMAIEVTSIPEPGRTLSLRRVAASVLFFFHDDPLSNRRLLFRTVFGLFALALVIGGDSLLGSYKYYSRLIDARLASGYLTSRSGLYAAPRTLRGGQKLARADLVVALRRAGYVKSESSKIWSGSFRESDAAIEIRPNANQARTTIVKISFDDDKKISEVTDDGISIDSFTLERSEERRVGKECRL